MKPVYVTASVAALGLSLHANAQQAGIATPQQWPVVSLPKKDQEAERRIDALIASMSLEQKVGQIVQGDIASVTPDDVARYHLGSVLNGGSSAPKGDDFGPASNWLGAADAYWEASMRPDGKLTRVPVMWGSDAVHGHNNIIGATLFPHNVGLGAARNPELMRQIGEITAKELRVTGLDWTFAPTIAVARDDRWGRTYESFAEDPALVTAYARSFVEGLQGRRGAPDWLRGPHVIATAKHFIADGGTEGGRDRGDARLPETELIRLHAPAYAAALEAGAQTVMASFSSWNSVKMHGNERLLTGVLKRHWGFDGFVVGDWDGHAKVTGCTATNCPAALLAGLDMYMAPSSGKSIYQSTLTGVRAGTIPLPQLDDAVRRVLRVKMRAGLFDVGKPSTRPYAGRYELLGAPEHRAVARQAVQQSLVLLKNSGLLPLKPSARILVAGDGADDLAKQSGGWTITWQGTGTAPRHFPGATSIWAGLRDAVAAGGGSAELSVQGRYTRKPDAAVVVFGEDPYAEFQGDRADLLFDDKANALEIMRRLKVEGIPVVAVFLSGRPLWVNRHINAADAFVAAWLPGSEGAGVSDVLFGRSDFRGKLPFSWPRDAKGTPLNVGDRDYRPLFPFGYGLKLSDRQPARPLPENPGIALGFSPTGPLFERGRATGNRLLQIGGANDSPQTIAGPADNGSVQVRAVDREAQEDALEVSWTGRSRGGLVIAHPRPVDLTRAGQLALLMNLKVDFAPKGPVQLEVRCGQGCTGRIDIAPMLNRLAGKGWQQTQIPVACLASADLSKVTAPFAISSSNAMRLTFASVALVRSTAAACP